MPTPAVPALLPKTAVAAFTVPPAWLKMLEMGGVPTLPVETITVPRVSVVVSSVPDVMLNVPVWLLEA